MDWEILLIGTYSTIMFFMVLLGVHRYHILWMYFRNKDKVPKPRDTFSEDELPRITVQLPFYNELHVAGRAIDYACRLDYPHDKLEIQVLDDSTDETTEICRRKVREWQAKGLNIKLLHRDDRSGFKAGALSQAVEVAEGDLFAMFDADFLPQPEILREMVHYFSDEKVGLVQARWGHVNRDFSTLCQTQAILLDGHVVLEQAARNRSGRFMNFDGTAGMWRRQAIIDGGGWEGDTLGEDVDLSYRSQLAGWNFIMLKDLVCDAELPPDMNSFKSQQQRWVKGHCQIVQKLIGKIWRSKVANLSQKIEATFHLFAIFTYPLVVVLMLLMLPMASITLERSPYIWLWFDLPVFLAATTSVWSFYLIGQKEGNPNWKATLRYIPLVISMGTAVSVSNTKAVLSGLMRRQTEFVRTPKYGLLNREDNWLSKKYDIKARIIPILELAFAAYLAVAFVLAAMNGRWLTLPFLFLFVLGFSYMGGFSIIVPMLRNASAKRAARRAKLERAPQEAA